MIKISITENQANQRLDRFLRKYLTKASLGSIYKMIRKDIKVNGKRVSPQSVLKMGDELVMYISQEDLSAMQKDNTHKNHPLSRKQFSVIYEDEKILVVSKPFGLLTHGDSREKKNHLANQVIDYLIQKGEYDPRKDTTFTPSPANRLDRNTTGLVIFGKTSESLKELNRMMKEREGIEKIYLTIVAGHLDRSLRLVDHMVKDEKKNMVAVSLHDEDKVMKTDVSPIKTSSGYTLAEVKIYTGRTHQIRVQLAAAGFPIIGDTKYGDVNINAGMKDSYGLTTQLLHAYKLKFSGCGDSSTLAYLDGKEFVCRLPGRFERIKKDIFG